MLELSGPADELAVTVDCGRGGLRLWSFRLFRPGTRVWVAVALGNEILTRNGRIVHATRVEGRRWLLGLHFTPTRLPSSYEETFEKFAA